MDGVSTPEELDMDLSDVKNAAMQHLVRREHSRLELTQKLILKNFSQEKIAFVLDEITEKGYLSDERYADLIVRSRINGGYGPLKIKVELRAKGVSDQIVESVIESYTVDWFALAAKMKIKHFGPTKPQSIKVLSKQVRYLQNRGFYQEHIEQVLKM